MVDDFIPDFTEDDDFEEPGVAAEQAQNRTFLIAAGVLAAVFVLGLIVAVLVVFSSRDGDQAVEATRNAIVQTNVAVETFVAETSVAALFTPEPTATVAATPSPTLDIGPTATQTPVVAATLPEGTVSTEVAELATLDETQVAAGTSTPFETVAPALEVTQLGGTGGEPTPTRIVSGVNGGDTSGGDVSPVVTALPSTGFATETPLATIGLMALALVAVVFAARRLRIS